MRLALAALFALSATGCAAPLTEQAREAFASDAACPVERVAIVGELHTSPFERYVVGGCHLRAEYMCSTSTGCDPARVRLSQHTGPSATDFPPSLVDEAPPPPPPPLGPQDGS